MARVGLIDLPDTPETREYSDQRYLLEGQVLLVYCALAGKIDIAGPMTMDGPLDPSKFQVMRVISHPCDDRLVLVVEPKP